MSFDKRILVVDDNRVMRQIVARALALCGFARDRIDEAADGAEALVQLRAGRHGAVLLDLNMPVMDGERFLAAVRSDDELRATPIVVVSSDGSAARERRLRLMGAAVVRKPFRPEQLQGGLAAAGVVP